MGKNPFKIKLPHYEYANNKVPNNRLLTMYLLLCDQLSEIASSEEFYGKSDFDKFRSTMFSMVEKLEQELLENGDKAEKRLVKTLSELYDMFDYVDSSLRYFQWRIYDKEFKQELLKYPKAGLPGHIFETTVEELIETYTTGILLFIELIFLYDRERWVGIRNISKIQFLASPLIRKYGREPLFGIPQEEIDSLKNKSFFRRFTNRATDEILELCLKVPQDTREISPFLWALKENGVIDGNIFFTERVKVADEIIDFFSLSVVNKTIRDALDKAKTAQKVNNKKYLDKIDYWSNRIAKELK